jgi:hypothetical protein
MLASNASASHWIIMALRLASRFPMLRTAVAVELGLGIE